MPRDLVDVLDYLLPAGEDSPLPPTARGSLQPADAESHPPAPSLATVDPFPEATHNPIEVEPSRASGPAAPPIITLPIGDRDVMRAAFAWNLAVEVARLGGNATLVAPADPAETPLWPSEDRGPLGAQLVLVHANSLGELNRAALDIAASRSAKCADGGVVLVRVPPEWITRSSDGRALLRWVLLFSSAESQDLREAYKLAKWIVQAGHAKRVGVTIHGARHIGDAERAFARISTSALRHLRHSLVSYGLLVDDLHIYRAIVAQRPIGLEHPQSRAARALRDVARLLLDDARNRPVD